MGVVTFKGLDVAVDTGRVMTPRQTSERLVDAAVAAAGDRQVRIADVGTGSGAIALALATALPQAEVIATDTSAEAVMLARANAARLGLGERVTVKHSDLLEPVEGPFDVIVANLPYLPLAEIDRHPDIADEPLEAVFAGGDGLGLYRALIPASSERLTPGGVLVIQLRARVLSAGRGDLEALATRLASSPPLRAESG